MASEPPPRDVHPPAGVRFLLVQLGYHAARRLGERLAPLGLEPRHYGVLRAVAALEGSTQQAVGGRLKLAAPRMVALIDDLEQRGLVERRRNPSDRRAYGLFLTGHGRSCLEKAQAAAAAEEEELLGWLDPEQREQLERLLRTSADREGLGDVVLPQPPA
jgi:DNA-binding MarR family transcriptional regulator